MAYLDETPTWDSVTRIETTEAVVGGPGGVSNRALQELTHRTAYLKDWKDNLTLDQIGGNLDAAAIADVLDQVIVKNGSVGSMTMSGLSSDGWHYVPSTLQSTGAYTVTFATAFPTLAWEGTAWLNCLRNFAAPYLSLYFPMYVEHQPLREDVMYVNLCFDGDLTAIDAWNTGRPIMTYNQVGI